MSTSSEHPRGPAHTTVVSEYLFAAETVAAPDFDPSEVVDFNELVGHQDFRACETVQRGIGSRFFANGVLSTKDELVVGLKRRYLELVGTLPGTRPSPTGTSS